MIYVLDTNIFTVLGHYFPKRFRSFWQEFNDLVGQGNIVSAREALKELDKRGNTPEHLTRWILSNKGVFLPPNENELLFVAEIFKVPHFQYLVKQKERLQGTPVADPFIIAAAKIRNDEGSDACVVTEEELKPNAAKIPNVCDHFGVDWTNLEGLMEREGWEF